MRQGHLATSHGDTIGHRPHYPFSIFKSFRPTLLLVMEVQRPVGHCSYLPKLGLRMIMFVGFSCYVPRHIKYDSHNYACKNTQQKISFQAIRFFLKAPFTDYITSLNQFLYVLYPVVSNIYILRGYILDLDKALACRGRLRRHCDTDDGSTPTQLPRMI